MPRTDQEILKRSVLDKGKLHDILYGKWAEWGGKKPPAEIRQKLLRSVPIDALKNLPDEIILDVSTVSSTQIGAFAAVEIEAKTVIGPIDGRLVTSLDKSLAESSWEIFDDKGNTTGYLETGNGGIAGSWMGLIRSARYAEEQNLEMFQEKSHVYYRVIKHIQAGEELLVWYSNCFPQYFGIPNLEPEGLTSIDTSTEADQTDPCTLVTSEEDRKKVSCVLCHKGFNSRSNLRSHMRTHTHQKPFQCTTCKRRFSQSSTLRNHTRLHTGEKPYKCYGCNCAYSQLAGLRAHQKSSQHRPKQRMNSDLV